MQIHNYYDHSFFYTMCLILSGDNSLFYSVDSRIFLIQYSESSTSIDKTTKWKKSVCGIFVNKTNKYKYQGKDIWCPEIPSLNIGCLQFKCKK